jgi:hypothetical protein
VNTATIATPPEVLDSRPTGTIATARPTGHRRSVFHGYVSLELAGGFEHSVPDAQESWAWIVDSLDALLRNRATP